MRVIVEFDPALAGMSQAPPVMSVGERSTEAIDGGGAPGSVAGGGGETPGSGDMGGPPQWLLDDVARTKASESDRAATAGAASDNGAGSQDGGASPE